MDVEEEEKEPMRATVRCRGRKGKAKDRFEYTGVRDCNAAELVAGGHKACIYGCWGMGSCVKARPLGTRKAFPLLTWRNTRRINSDHLACAPILLEVRETMMPYLYEEAGNMGKIG